MPLLAGCATGEADRPLRLLVPNAPGGGYDTTARVLGGAIGEVDDETVDVFNLPGGSGVVGLARLDRERGNQHLLMMMGLGVVGAANAGTSPHGLGDVTPLARLLSEPDLVLVRSDSTFARFPELARAWRRRPAGILVGGGSLPGGPDHLATYQLAEALGVPAGRVRYETFDGGGPLLAALLAGRVDVVMSGVLESIDQVRSGSVRALAVTSGHRVPGLDTRTLGEWGVAVEFENWRGVVAPPGLTDADRTRLVDLLRRAVRSDAWQEAASRNGWTNRWLAGEEFASFLATEDRRTAELLSGLPAGRTGG